MFEFEQTLQTMVETEWDYSLAGELWECRHAISEAIFILEAMMGVE